MNSTYKLKKIQLKIKYQIIKYTRNKVFYFWLYPSYWHSKVSVDNKINGDINYFSATPHYGAGIGHQMANWIAGYWFSKQFKLKFAHTPFVSQRWEKVLGFGNDEISVKELQKKGYKIIRLPLFDEYNITETSKIKNIINSYKNKRVIFMAEQDQFYKDQIGVMKDLKDKFHNSPERKNDNIFFDNNFFNVAVHVRRGDITINNTNNENLIMRYQSNNYFVNVLNNVIENVNYEKPLAIHLFSQGTIENFSDFDIFDNIKYYLNLDEHVTFLHMVYSDILITSKSSFSYKAALLNNGIKVCPDEFWHTYPENDDWITIK